MSRTDLDLRTLDFITIGTIGPKGKRMFHLQAGQGNQIVTFNIEKEQAWALGEAIKQFLDDLDQRNNEKTQVEMASLDMDLREPIQPLFRVAQMGLAYEEETQMIILIAQEMVLSLEGESEEDEEADDLDVEDSDAGVVRMWATLEQMRALSLQAIDMVEQGRPNPRQNGRITYYWT
jgi:uncharacterized repeat protein (TIGR03847 family)